MNKLIVSLSPHVHGGDSVKKNMYGVLIALIPAFLVSLYFFGLGALIVTATSVAACLFFEWAIGKFLMKKETTTITDGSAIITGVLLAFNLPSNLPIWIIILGALFAIGVGKMSFGGLGCNPFNPALAGRVFLLLSFPVQMTTWPAGGQLTAYTDATTAATPHLEQNRGENVVAGERRAGDDPGPHLVDEIEHLVLVVAVDLGLHPVRLESLRCGASGLVQSGNESGRSSHTFSLLGARISSCHSDISFDFDGVFQRTRKSRTEKPSEVFRAILAPSSPSRERDGFQCRSDQR